MHGLIFLLQRMKIRNNKILNSSIYPKKHQETKKRGITYLIIVCPKITVKIVVRTHFLERKRD